MADGSRKSVQWAPDISELEPGSPFTEASSSYSFNSTSSLQYINSQLIAHGFTTSPGISLEGISDRDCEGIAKCLLAMLSQRVNDMSRTEDLSTKLRTLSYDYERLKTMHCAATEKAANAERETNLFKSRLATATRALQSSEAAHKQTTMELQRTKSSLQGLRATHVAELRRKERDIEKMVEKWTKLADCQAKLSSVSSGLSIRGGNAEISSVMDTLGKGKGYLEVALEHAETSRAGLLDETTRLRRLIVMSANRMQTLIHEIRSLASVREEQPASLDHDALFPMTPMNAANDRLMSLFASASDALSDLSKRLVDRTGISQASNSESFKASDSAECKLIMTKLQAELDEAKKLRETHEDEIRRLLNQIAEQAVPKTASKISVDLTVSSERDAERNHLPRIKKELDDERQNDTDPAIRVGQEKTEVESKRIQFQEGKRSWQTVHMPSELPTPALDVTRGSHPCPLFSLDVPPRSKKSPRKSPRKPTVVGKVGSTRRTRMPRRSSILSIPPSTRVEPAYETEVIPIVVSALETGAHTTTNLARSILPTSFVLPPPSPRTSLPPPPETLLGSTDSSDNSPPNDSRGLTPATPEESPPQPTIIQRDPQLTVAQAPVLPHTPAVGRRPFPMAKPLAPHMIHAYSPVKPSPLSRILMLANSPDSPESEPVKSPQEVEVAAASTTALAKGDDESPLREKRPGRNISVETRGHRGSDKGMPKGKLKPKAEVASSSVTNKARTARAGEKENRSKTSHKVPASQPHNNSGTNRLEHPGRASVKMPGKLAPGKGGARRVPIDSAEAAPLPNCRE